MSDINSITLTGNVVAKPEVRFTPSGVKTASFRIGCNRKYKGGDGEIKEQAIFVTINTWNGTADACAKYLDKGDKVAVQGRLDISSYEQDGVTKWYTKVVASQVQFLSNKHPVDAAQSDPASEPEFSESIPF